MADSPGQVGPAVVRPVADPVGLPAGLAAARAGVAAAVAGLERVWALGEGQVVDCLLVAEALGRQVDALRLGLIRAHVSRAPTARSRAARTAPTRRVLEDLCHYTPARAGQLIGDAELIDPDEGRLAGLGAALAAGDVTLEHVDVARLCLRQLPAKVVREHGPVLDELLTGHARRYHPQATRALAEHLLAVLGVEKAERDPDRGRYLSLAHSGGVTHIAGQVDELTGRYLQTLLDILLDGDNPHPSETTGDTTTGSGHAHAVDDELWADDTFPDNSGTGDDEGSGSVAGQAGSATDDQAHTDTATANGNGKGNGNGTGDRQAEVLDARSMGQRRADAFSELIALAGEHLALVRDPETGQPATTGHGGQLNQRPSQTVPRLVLHLNETDRPDTSGPSGSSPDNAGADRAGSVGLRDDGTDLDRQHADDGATTDIDDPARPPRPSDQLAKPRPPGQPPHGGRWAGFTATSQQLDPLAPHLSDLASCDAVLDLARFDGRGRLISFTSIGRIAGERLIAAVVARDRCCTFPGCTRPPAMCQVHHVTWHRHGGPTELDNLALLCGPHHRLVHSKPLGHPDAWTMVMRKGIPCFSPPEHLAPYGHDGTLWIRNTYATDHLATRQTAHQLTLDTG